MKDARQPPQWPRKQSPRRRAHWAETHATDDLSDPSALRGRIRRSWRGARQNGARAMNARINANVRPLGLPKTPYPPLDARDELNPGRLPFRCRPRNDDQRRSRRSSPRTPRRPWPYCGANEAEEVSWSMRGRDSRRADPISVARCRTAQESVTSVAVAPEALAQEASSPQPASTAEAVVSSKRKIRSPPCLPLQSQQRNRFSGEHRDVGFFALGDCALDPKRQIRSRRMQSPGRRGFPVRGDPSTPDLPLPPRSANGCCATLLEPAGPIPADRILDGSGLE